MKITFNNNPQYNSLTQFKGKGIDYINHWQNDRREIRISWYKDIMSDLSDGARLYFVNNKAMDDSVTKFHSYGGLSILFDLPDEEVLKISLEDPLEYRKHRSEFDIPFLSPVEKYGKTYIVKQPKADVAGMTREHYKDVVKRIYTHGCELSKDGTKYEQYGLYQGKAYLLDTRCAMPLPSVYTIIIDNICKRINKCYVFVDKEQGEKEKELAYKEKGYFSYHTNETPRQSLTLKGGLSKLFNTIRNNIKYRKKHYCIPYDVFCSQKLNIRKYYQM